jgi:hypothetical protein
MEHPPIKGTPLPAAAENWESEGGATVPEPTKTPTLHLISNMGRAVNNRRSPPQDDKRAQLRTIVATINREMARLPRPATTEAGDGSAKELIVSWNSLVNLLALGPAPETRECPVCAQTGMADAIRCGYCWAPLPSL